MGKQGPCGHCGVTSTPLWRNGPPDKPILCNACGSRWRTKGTLVNYTPLHARLEPDEFEDNRISKVKIISIKNKEAKLLKRKQYNDNVVGGTGARGGGGGGGTGGGGGGGIFSDHHHHHGGGLKGLEEDMSNRSSSGSVISNSDSCMQLGNGGASDLTGQTQSSTIWDTMVPSRKRTCINKPKQTPVEKLTKDLYTILHEQKSYFSASSEDDLIFEKNTSMVSVEIGHGSVLIRHPNSREEESEASSLSFDTKNDAFSRFLENNADKGGNFSSRSEMSKKPVNQDQIHGNNDENLRILVNHNSPLCYIDLKDVINFDGFSSQLTTDEQQQLLKYLPPVDTVQLPDSIKGMFNSHQFTENLNSFQELLEKGVFDLSLPATKNENRRTLKNLALYNATKSKWIEQYNLLQDSKCKYDHGEIRNFVAPEHSVNVKKSRDAQIHLFPGSKSQPKELVDKDGVGFSPRSLFTLPPDNIDYLRYEPESFDQDLLFDVPSHTSFPHAELLFPSSFAYQNIVHR